MNDYTEPYDEKERVFPENEACDMINGLFDAIEKSMLDEVLKEKNYD